MNDIIRTMQFWKSKNFKNNRDQQMAFERTLQILIEHAPTEEEKKGLLAFAFTPAEIQMGQEMRDLINLMPSCYEGKSWGKWFRMINFILKNRPDNITALRAKEIGVENRKRLWLIPLLTNALFIQCYSVDNYDKIIKDIFLHPPFGISNSSNWSCGFQKGDLLRKLREKTLTQNSIDKEEFIRLFWIIEPEGSNLSNFKTKEMILDECKKNFFFSFLHRIGLK